MMAGYCCYYYSASGCCWHYIFGMKGQYCLRLKMSMTV